MLVNLADDPAYFEKPESMRGALIQYLEKTEDPRIKGSTPWDDYHKRDE